jgi:hypothetical protein
VFRAVAQAAVAVTFAKNVGHLHIDDYDRGAAVVVVVANL